MSENCCKRCNNAVTAAESITCNACGSSFHLDCLSFYLALRPSTKCYAGLSSAFSSDVSTARRKETTRAVASTRVASRTSSLDSRRGIPATETAAVTMSSPGMLLPAGSPQSPGDVAQLFAVLARMEATMGDVKASMSDVMTSCSELKAASATTNLKLDKAIATLESHAGRIEALEARQRQTERYLCKVKPCTELKIVGILSALVSNTDKDTRGICASVLKLIGAENNIADVNELPASALLPGVAGSLRFYEMHSGFVHDLLRKARTTATACGYRHVWARDGIVCVRKSDGADVIELLSESDLESLL
ncbi:unnamed protein product [Trichogramma brassicae]|uniref:FP protein C-terminal domain-containing protein n=1 Tax=Trichogramma brassicae TaxID=86971 RepID=A0A6H5IZ26_9HYME|nr:unnamed protein product [Trichogramma brassicae]